ncbi:uncharacterized protein FFB14_07061 [Fusarium fujikuroi]|nr:uncharacterized protein FFB14_07061 [Fusarium fujikuroi]
MLNKEQLYLPLLVDREGRGAELQDVTAALRDLSRMSWNISYRFTVTPTSLRNMQLCLTSFNLMFDS